MGGSSCTSPLHMRFLRGFPHAAVRSLPLCFMLCAGVSFFVHSGAGAFCRLYGDVPPGPNVLFCCPSARVAPPPLLLCMGSRVAVWSLPTVLPAVCCLFFWVNSEICLARSAADLGLLLRLIITCFATSVFPRFSSTVSSHLPYFRAGLLAKFTVLCRVLAGMAIAP